MERLASFFRAADDFIQRRVDAAAALLRRWPGIRLSTLIYIVQAIAIICLVGIAYAAWHLTGERWLAWVLIITVGLSLSRQNHTHKTLVEREVQGSTEPIRGHRLVFDKSFLAGILMVKIPQKAGLWSKSGLAHMLPSEQHWSSMVDLWLIAFAVAALAGCYLLRSPPAPHPHKRPD